MFKSANCKQNNNNFGGVVLQMLGRYINGIMNIELFQILA